MTGMKKNLTPQQEALAQEIIEKRNELERDRVLEKFKVDIDAVLTRAGLAEGKDYIIEIRYKSPDRIREKILRKKYTNSERMQDLAGAMVVVKNERNMTRVQRLTQQNYGVKNIVDYRKNSERIYNGININLRNGIELQIKDSMEYFLGFWDHDPIYKNMKIEKRYKERLIGRLRKNLEEYIHKNNVEIGFSRQNYFGVIGVLRDTIREVLKVPSRYGKGGTITGIRTSLQREHTMKKPTGVPVSYAKRKRIENSAIDIAKNHFRR